MNTSLVSVYTLKSDFLRLHKAQEEAKLLGLNWDDVVQQDKAWLTLQGFIVSVGEECTMETFDKEVVSFPCLASIPSMKSMYQLGQKIEADVINPSLWEGEPVVGEIRIAQAQELAVASSKVSQSSPSVAPAAQVASSNSLHLDDVLKRLNQETDKKWQQYAKEGNFTEAVLTIRKTHGFSPSLALEAVKHFRLQMEQQEATGSDTQARLQQMMPTFTSWFGKKKDKSSK